MTEHQARPTNVASPSGEDQEFPAGTGGGLAVLLLAAHLSGGVAGMVGTAFRVALTRADVLRNALVIWCRGFPVFGWLILVAVAAVGAGFAHWLVVVFARDASGSGVPQVEGIVRVGGSFHSRFVLPVKFLGGVAAIGSGLALGREGPTVQKGSAAAEWVGKLFRLPPRRCGCCPRPGRARASPRPSAPPWAARSS